VTVRVVVVDDQPLVREGLRKILGAHPELKVVGDVGDGAAALDAVTRLEPDVVVMDIRMPVLDGIEATRRITEGREPPKVLVLTTFDLDEYVFRALEAGASGFLLKDAPPGRLVDAVRTVADGEALLAPAVTRRLIERHLRAPVATGKPPADLSPREMEVWLLVAQGLSNAEIAGALVVTEATVKAHVTRLLAKLGVRDRVQAVVRAYETGVVRPGE